MYALVNPGLERGVQYLAYPLMVLAGLTVHFILVSSGLGNFLASTLPVLICLGGILLLEMKFPYRRDWSASFSDIKTDFSLLVVVQGIAPKILGLAVSLLLAQSAFDPEALDGIWPKNWNILGQTLLMILLADLLRYWLHVAAHKVPFLWKLHAIHHQPKKLYSVNVARFHPTEKALHFLFDTLPFILLGVAPEVIACYFVFYAINGFIQHSNIDLRFGFLNYIISTSELHRWHHDEDHEVGNCNYGNNLIIWDLIFGSYYFPTQKTSQKVGIKGIKPAGFLEALMLPYKDIFRLTRIKESAHNIAIGILYKLAKFKYWKRFEYQCEHPEATQNELLRKIVSRQSGTSFGKQNGFSGLTSYQDYRDHVAVNNYEDLRPLYEKQARRNTPEISSEPPILYAQTSGSTGKPKYIPVTRQSLADLKKSQTLSSLMMHEACPDAFRGKILAIVSPAEEGYNEWGKLCGSASGLIAENMPEIIQRKQLLPSEVFTIHDYDLKYDLITLFALAEENISFLGTANPSTLLHLLKLISTKKYYYLDVLSGNSSQLLPNKFGQIEKNLLAKISCSQARLAWLKRLFATTQDLSPGDLWPNLRLIVTWTGGSCGVPLGAVTKNLPKSCRVMELGYVASELRGTITHYKSGLGIPTLYENFFEFVEKKNWQNGAGEFLQLHEIKEGCQYYVFITNQSGLYRYDMNDIVQVSGFFKNTPCLKFIQKGKGTTNITGEKLYEAHLISAVGTLAQEYDIHPVFYVCLANEMDSKYELYLETSDYINLSQKEVSGVVDKLLSTINLEYRVKRESNRLNNIEVKLLKPETSEVYKKALVNKGQRECQFKVMTLQYARDCNFPFDQYLIA